MHLLQDIKRREADVRYLPRYLHGAVSRHIGLRAEELSARAKAIQPKVAKLVKGLRQVEVREPTTTEILAAVYRDTIRQTRAARFARACAQQRENKKQKEFALGSC